MALKKITICTSPIRVRELIAVLKTCPQDARVMFSTGPGGYFGTVQFIEIPDDARTVLFDLFKPIEGPKCG